VVGLVFLCATGSQWIKILVAAVAFALGGGAALWPHHRLWPCAFPIPPFSRAFILFTMIAPETFNHIENIKKRAGHLWRFL
jgi:hypothetical protein